MDTELAGQVEADEIFDALANGKHFDRELAQGRAGRVAEPTRAALRARIVEALPEFEGEDYVWMRSWLLSTLGRVAGDDSAALDTLRSRVSDDENPWVRYWGLEGAVIGSVPILAELGTIAKDDPDELPRYLGFAIVASTARDDEAKEALIQALSSDDQGRQWLALRALRVMPVTGTVKPIAAILDKPLYSEVNYQAVVALGAVPRDNAKEVETAALALLSLVVDKRNELMWTEARGRALFSLGRLCFPASAPTLVDELLDGNPSTVREAAMALETVLGTDRAVDRVAEAATGAESTDVAAYAQALRWMRRDRVAEHLEQIAMSGQGETPDVARELLTELGGAVAFQKLQARAKSMERYAEVLDKAEASVRQQFTDSIDEARHGYTVATRMDIAVFILGMVLLATSAAAALITEGSLTLWATAGTGVAAMVYSLFIADPRKRVEQAVDHLMYLKVVFLGYLRQLHQIDQVFSRRVLDDEPINAADVEAFAQLVGMSMRDAVTNLRLPQAAVEQLETAAPRTSSVAAAAGLAGQELEEIET